MRAEAAAALAEMAARFRHGVMRHHHRLALDGGVDEPDHLAGFLAALVLERLVHHHDHVARARLFVLREFRDRHRAERERGMRADERRQIELAHHRIAQILGRRLFRAGQKLLAVDDLHDAAFVGAVAEIDAVGLRPERDHAVQHGRHRAGRARLLPGQAEVADLHRMRRIAQVVDLRHAVGAPARRARHQIGDAGVAFPPALMRALEAGDAREERGLGRIGHVPDFVRAVAEGAQQIEFALVGFGQRAAGADAHHLRAAGFVFAGLAGNVMQIFRLRRVGDVEDRGAVVLGLAGQRIDRLAHVGRAAMVADIGDVALALMEDRRLIGAAVLQVAIADQPHVLGFRRRTDLLLLRGNRCDRQQTHGENDRTLSHGTLLNRRST